MESLSSPQAPDPSHLEGGADRQAAEQESGRHGPDPCSREDAIDPDLSICDSHHHLLDASQRTPYSVEDFVADAARGHHIVRSVFVECSQGYRRGGDPAFRPVGETEYVMEALRKCASLGGPDVAGIVAAADLCLGDRLADLLDAHANAARTRFRGIRARLAYDPLGAAGPTTGEGARPVTAADPAFREGVALLGNRDLCLDIWAYHMQLADICDLAGAVPDTTIVLNHLGCPLAIGPYEARRQEVDHEWRHGMAELAKHPRVRVKLGGIGRARLGYDWTAGAQPLSSDHVAERVSDRVHFVIDTFGPSRCMFESNFPSDREGLDYVTIWNAFKKLTSRYSAAERRMLFHDTAVETYGLVTDAPDRRGLTC